MDDKYCLVNTVETVSTKPLSLHEICLNSVMPQLKIFIYAVGHL